MPKYLTVMDAMREILFRRNVVQMDAETYRARYRYALNVAGRYASFIFSTTGYIMKFGI